MVNVMRRLRWPSELALLAMGVALICGISTELIAGTGGWLIGIIPGREEPLRCELARPSRRGVQSRR